MSYQTTVNFLNGNDKAFLKAKNGTPEERQRWLYDWGSIEDRPGAVIEGCDDIAEETGDEYGGLLIEVSKIPKNATHIVVYRS